MDMSLYDALLKWLRTFPGHENLTTNSLTDGVALGALLHQIAPECFSNQWKAKIRTDVNENWRLKVSNLRKIHQGVMDYFCSELAGQAIDQFPNPDLNKIGEFGDEIELGRLLQLVLGCAINCEQKQNHIEAIMRMEEGVQALIVNAIQDLMNREQSPGVQDPSSPSGGAASWLGPASFHPHMKTLVEQLESTSLAKEDMTRRCNELELQLSVVTEERSKLKEETLKLSERLDILQSGGEIGAPTSRYKDLKKQVDTLQDDLYKLESSRDEYRSRSEELERESKEINARNEELQKFADEARSLKDEVDALRDMSDRVAVYEGTVETYKKKMEELSDLKRQIKILEEKNSDYMQINMELEEEVKKSGTWRPQLDLYKKQVGDLHQKLAEEAKKTDRQIFENKKITEKLEAVTQEKERMNLERDLLKENIDDLRMTALSSPENSSRPPSDLEDIHTLEIIPPEIREKLVRLQHENRVLKQRADEKPSESGPVLQSLLNDLQERHDKLLQENRWGDKLGAHAPPWPSPFLSAFLMAPPKWASESDLIIRRQSNQVTSYAAPPPKSLTLPSSSKHEQPIVIRHIHEFKVPPASPEDSGCCRTSPSSCEDPQSGTFTPPDSGVSGMFRCLSPVIPSIVEECTTHHMSDILPVLSGGEPGILYHSHTSHPPCNRCCSPYSCMHDPPPPPPPPESPTPHNSPRLPHSIHSSRTKTSAALRSAFFDSSVPPQSLPPPNLQMRSNKPKKNHENRISTSSSTMSDQSAPPVKSGLDRLRSKNPDRVRSKTPDRLKAMLLPDRFRASLREKNDSSACEKKLKMRSKSLDKGKIKASSKLRHSKDDSTLPSSTHDIISKRNDFIDSVIIAPKAPSPVCNEQKLQTSSAPIGKLIGKSSLPTPYGGGASPEKKSFELRGTSPFRSLRTHKSTVPLTGSFTSLQEKKKRSQTPKSSSGDVTLLTDTMFTHFIVTPKPSSKEFFRVSDPRFHSTSKLLMMNSDIENDAELLEQRLTAGVFAAPLGSSESSISMQQSDITDDLDPSATDYNTDHLSDIHQLSGGRTFLETDLDAPDFAMGRRKPDPRGGTLRVKNRTAKAVVAETFNAMFTFCTP